MTNEYQRSIVMARDASGQQPSYGRIRGNLRDVKGTLIMRMYAVVLLLLLQGCSTQRVDEYEPVSAAGEHHVPIIDNERVRVLEVTIQPGETVPYHLHSMSSVFITIQPASLVFYDLDGNVLKRVDRDSFDELPMVEWRGPAPAPRKVQNVDEVPLRALRIEIKE